jgi:hypothetical protein
VRVTVPVVRLMPMNHNNQSPFVLVVVEFEVGVVLKPDVGVVIPSNALEQAFAPLNVIILPDSAGAGEPGTVNI